MFGGNRQKKEKNDHLNFPVFDFALENMPKIPL